MIEDYLTTLAGAGQRGTTVALRRDQPPPRRDPEAIARGRETVNRDQATDINVSVDEDRKTLGRDGRERSYPVPPKPKPEPPAPDTEEEIVAVDDDEVRAAMLSAL
jgi:hypothetical protein